MNAPRPSELTGTNNYFEDFQPGQRMRHARGATVGDVENNLVTKQVMNTAQGHWNDHAMQGSPMGEGRLVFGLVTASLVFGLASQDTAENALAELSCTALRFRSPVHLGDTVYAYTEVISAQDAPDRPDAGVVQFKHWGALADGRVVFEGMRTVLVKRKSVWGSNAS